MLGLGLGITGIRGLWSPARLFAGGAQGIFIDPSVLSSLSQDNLGATPVTGPGQSVGRVLDRSGRGNHPTQAVAAAKPTLGRHPRGGRRNLLSASTSFAPWSGIAASAVDGVAIGFGGELTMAKLVESDSNSAHFLSYWLTTAPGTHYTISVVAKAGERSVLQLLLPASAFGSNIAGVFDLTSGASIIKPGASGGAIALGGGYYRCWLSSPATATVSADLQIRTHTTYAYVLTPYQGDGVSGLYIDTPQIEIGAEMTPYQRVTTQYDVTEAGVPNVWYLGTDGIDDYLTTPTINWGTDEMEVIYAARKTGDDVLGVLAGYGLASQDGSWSVVYPGAPADTWGRYGKAFSRGTSNVGAGISSALTQYAGPQTIVGGYRAKISTDTLIPRVNGVDLAGAGTDQGGGIYADRAMVVGAASNALSPYTGMIYGLMVINRLLTPTERSRVERYFASRIGVTLA